MQSWHSMHIRGQMAAAPVKVGYWTHAHALSKSADSARLSRQKQRPPSACRHRNRSNMFQVDSSHSDAHLFSHHAISWCGICVHVAVSVSQLQALYRLRCSAVPL